MEAIFKILILAVVSYFLGSFPTAVLVSKKFFGFDIRQKGSGNMGSTNAFRVLGWKWGLLVQIIDILKGVLAVIVIGPLFATGVTFPNATSFEHMTIIKIIAGVSAVLGHVFSAFVGFRGGKGINTAAGMLVAILPVDVSIALGIFILAVIFSGYISLGSIAAAFTLPGSLIVRYNLFHVNIPNYEILVTFSIFITLLVIYTHRSNIKRLLHGQENRFKSLHLIRIFGKAEN